MEGTYYVWNRDFLRWDAFPAEATFREVFETARDSAALDEDKIVLVSYGCPIPK